QVERLEHAVQASGQFFPGRNFERNAWLADSWFGPRQPLGDRRFRGKKGSGDLRGTEAAKSFERERDLHLLRNERMTTCKHHAQMVIRDAIIPLTRQRRY